MPDHESSNKKRKWVPKTASQDDMAEKLVGKLHHHAREVRKAAKKAKAFETQRVVKKLKGLRSKSADSTEVADSEAQLELLKGTDHEPFANTALRTKILKDKMLSENEHMQDAIAKELSTNLVTPAEPGSNLAKVQARLLSSKLIATEVAAVVNALKLTISPERKAGPEAEGSASGTAGDDEMDVSPPAKKVKLAKPQTSSSDEREDEDSDREINESDQEVDDGGWESGSVHDSDSDGDEDEAAIGPGDTGDDSSSDEDEDSPNPKQVAVKAASTKKQPKPKADAKVSGESTFLPSLSVGFTRGDSDASDWSDGDADVAPKKNRRGQRARRAIWEKKYGKNANHVKNQPVEPARGHPDRSRQHGDRQANGARSRPPFNASRASGPRDRAPTQRPQPPHMDKQNNDKPLHPSWEAKKKMKEKQNPTIVPPQGKKIVF